MTPMAAVRDPIGKIDHFQLASPVEMGGAG
jgi:hypothetical protein